MATADENLRELALCLDQLALAYRFVKNDFEELDYPSAPSSDYNRLCELARERFPDFGWYQQLSNIEVQNEEAAILTHDALDDIADIALALDEVRWCWENTSHDDAMWHFKFGYESHWGDHLRHLQLYVHVLKRGQTT